MPLVRSTVPAARPRRRGPTLGVLGLLALLGGFFWARTGRARSDAPPAAPSADAVSLVATEARPSPLAANARPLPSEAAGPRPFATGDVLRWTVVARSEVVLAVGGLPEEAATPDAGDRRVSLAVEGALELRVYAADAAGALVGFALEDATLASTGGAVAADAAGRAEPALAEEVLARLAADGRVSAVAFPPQLSEELRAVWRDVLARWQVALPPAADVASWEADESDPSGPHLAVYRRATERGPYAVEKQKTHLAAGLAVEGGTRIRLRTRAEEIEWDERAVMRPAAAFEARVEAAFQGRASLVAERRDETLAARGDDRRVEAARRGLAPLHTAAAGGEDADGGLLPDAPSAIAGVEEAWGGQGEVTALRGERLKQLVRVLQASDAAVAEVVARMRDAGLSESVAAALAGALASAGTTATARALAVVLSDPTVSPDARYASVVATALHAAPTREVDVALRAVIDADRDGPLFGAALLARGSVAESVRLVDPTWHADVVQALAAEAAIATDVARLSVVMEAIGNAAPGSPPEVVRAAMTSDDPERRAAALRALRNTRDAGALALLRAGYAADPDESVRLGALEIVLEAGHPLRCEALEHLARQEASESVRRAAAAWAESDGPCGTPGR